MSVGQPKRELSPPIIICNYLFLYVYCMQINTRESVDIICLITYIGKEK